MGGPALEQEGAAVLGAGIGWADKALGPQGKLVGVYPGSSWCLR